MAKPNRFLLAIIGLMVLVFGYAFWINAAS